MATASKGPRRHTDIDVDHIDMDSANSSQQSLPSTEGPTSPIDPEPCSLSNPDQPISFKTEPTDSQSRRTIPSSLTPPPSSQYPATQQTDDNGNGTLGLSVGYISSQRANVFSPPPTTLNKNANASRRYGTASSGAALPTAASTTSDYVPPTADQIADASADEVRNMLHACLAENARLKMETAHHKLQYNLLSMQADEDAKRAAVEHDMTRREVQALRLVEDSRLARRELDAAAQTTLAKYLQLKNWHDAAVEENDGLYRRLKLAKKVIQQKEDEVISLTDERDMLLNRIRENREHFHMLCSPGGVFHGALTPKTPAAATPQQQHCRTTPQHTPKTIYHREARHENDPEQAGFAVLLQALSHDNNSAPSTPVPASRPPPRMPSRHTRGVQSLSSLPTTPSSRAHGGDRPGLLPSVDLVPRTEPAHRYSGSRSVMEAPTPTRRKSRESTISADDNEELARAALESVAAATQSYMSQDSRGSRRRSGKEEEVYESQASQAASEMLRRDPREAYLEVASSVGSRDGTPAPAEKTAKLQSKLFAGVNKAVSASEKRKFGSGAVDMVDDIRRDGFASPAKKMRHGSGGDETHQRIGLGIRYSRER
ncbi:hypothetical protein DL764_005009 [Monosporascus ibericus]|uniref:FAD-dependent oxidoreductase-like enzyme n=1 Tax=Monosporascus ibericus TaxID=155417 RepID=A0A4Q4TDT0_9PEZI|nr:hypothetical protein DL764_005009 [Monosporascus ibericus]